MTDSHPERIESAAVRIKKVPEFLEQRFPESQRNACQFSAFRSAAA